MSEIQNVNPKALTRGTEYGSVIGYKFSGHRKYIQTHWHIYIPLDPMIMIFHSDTENSDTAFRDPQGIPQPIHALLMVEKWENWSIIYVY